MSSPHHPEPDVSPDPQLVLAVERTAADLARSAGEHICAAYGGELQVAFKQPRPGADHNSNPVSHVDREVEALVRARLAHEFRGHTVIGEELAARQGTAGFAWVIDPIDGTTNFVNGLPLFACSIGVLYRGRPLAGAIWCASTHAFRPGTYHASAAGNSLHFDGQPLARRACSSWRGLAAEPGTAPSYARYWDTRVLGCAAVEFAYVAAGLLRIAYIPHPRIWDVAAGLALLRAAGCESRVKRGSGWDTLLYLPQDELAARRWSEPLLIGAKSDLEHTLRQSE